MAYVYLWLERSVTPAWGLFGGREAIGPEVVINGGRPDERRMLKANAHPVRPGSVVDLMTGGGGGYGVPTERDPERVRDDVIDGFVEPRGGGARLRRRARRRPERRRGRDERQTLQSRPNQR